MTRPLFAVGTARGGTNLLAKMLSVHPDVYLSSDPYRPLLRSLRNGILRHAAPADVQPAVPPDSPFDDYYFSRRKWPAFELIQASTLEIPFLQTERPALLKAMAARAALSASNVIPFLDRLKGDTYRDFLQASLKILEPAANVEGRRWVGFKENWAVEFLPALARSFPEAKFIILLRDPRAAVASVLRGKEFSKIPHVISFARHWRKAVALMVQYRQLALFQDRLHVLMYEDLVSEPERCARELCDFLEVGFESGMLDTSRYQTPEGGTWKRNTNYGAPAFGIDTSTIRAWEKTLSEGAIELVELICGPEMCLLGQANTQFSPGDRLSPQALRFAETDHRNSRGWRSSLGEVEQEIGCEYFRYTLLEQEVDAMDPWWRKTSFLTQEVLELIKSERSILAG